ncbi:MAG: hypothetical protein ACRDSL_24990 [Pseudonocardiaceae bacterium]
MLGMVGALTEFAAWNCSIARRRLAQRDHAAQLCLGAGHPGQAQRPGLLCPPEPGFFEGDRLGPPRAGFVILPPGVQLTAWLKAVYLLYQAPRRKRGGDAATYAWSWSSTPRICS